MTTLPLLLSEFDALNRDRLRWSRGFHQPHYRGHSPQVEARIRELADQIAALHLANSLRFAAGRADAAPAPPPATPAT
jgi:hypothetical protein